LKKTSSCYRLVFCAVSVIGQIFISWKNRVLYMQNIMKAEGKIMK